LTIKKLDYFFFFVYVAFVKETDLSKSYDKNILKNYNVVVDPNAKYSDYDSDATFSPQHTGTVEAAARATCS
jgi:hypothetical protein